MIHIPSLRSAPLFPVTACTAMAAIAVSLWCWSGGDTSLFTFNALAWGTEPWRLVTSALPHGDPLHLLFNLFWLWAFGTLIEDVIGSQRVLALYMLLSAGSGAAQYALSQGGIGLSGVGYGLFGFLWASHRWSPRWNRPDPRLAEALDDRTVMLFVGWFFFCLATTMLGIWRIGNIAHAAGALLGFLRGLSHTAHPWRRASVSGMTAATLLLVGLGASFARPYVNLSRDVGRDLARTGYEALTGGDLKRAAKMYQRATNAIEASWFPDRKLLAHSWHNLSVAYGRLGLYQASSEARAREEEVRAGRPAASRVDRHSGRTWLHSGRDRRRGLDLP